MATKCVVNKSTMSGIADAIRAKGGTTDAMLPSEMAAKIAAIPSGGSGGLDWAKPDDWPAFDLLDPRTGSDEKSLFVLCDSRIGVTPFLSVSSCTRLELLDLHDDGSWSVKETFQTTDNKICIWLDKSEVYTVWRCVGAAAFAVSVADETHPEVFEYGQNSVCGEILYGGSSSIAAAAWGQMTRVSTNYYSYVIFLKFVDVNIISYNLNGWRSCLSLRCIVYDGFTSTGQSFGRSFDSVPTLQKVVIKNTTEIMRSGANVFVGHYSSSKMLDYDWSHIDPSSVTDIANICTEWSMMRGIDFTKYVHWGVKEDGTANVVGEGGKITSVSSAFSGCRCLCSLNISCFDLSGVANTASALYNCWAMQDLTMPPPERNLRVSFDIHYFTLMSRENIVKILNSLADISGGASQTLTMGSVMLGKLTDADKAIATGKGWTLA